MWLKTSRNEKKTARSLTWLRVYRNQYVSDFLWPWKHFAPSEVRSRKSGTLEHPRDAGLIHLQL